MSRLVNTGPTVTVGGQSTATLLTIVFVILKLTGYINWSWWWVLSPTLIGLVLFLIVLVAVGIFAAKHQDMYRL